MVMQQYKIGLPFPRFGYSWRRGIAAGKGRLFLALVLFTFTTTGFGQADPDVTGKVTMVNPAGVQFSIVPRIPELTYYPCTQCHEFMTPNPEIRELSSPHPSELTHGDQRMWCLTCHKIDDRNSLTNLLGEPVDFDRAADVCASCHMQRHNDWMSGGHGKRVANWQGDRVIYSCPQCHDPHAPSIKPRAPKPHPPDRKGLARETHVREAYLPVWKRLEIEEK